MVQRIFLGYSAGFPIIRISKPGKEALSSNPDDLLLTETSITMRPSTSGSRAFSGKGTGTVGLSGFTAPPYVMLKSNDGTLPTVYNFYARISTDYSLLTIVNAQSIARTITFYVFGNTL